MSLLPPALAFELRYLALTAGGREGASVWACLKRVSLDLDRGRPGIRSHHTAHRAYWSSSRLWMCPDAQAQGSELQQVGGRGLVLPILAGLSLQSRASSP